MGLTRRNPARTLVFTVPDMLFDMIRPEIRDEIANEAPPAPAPRPSVAKASPSREERRRMIAAAAYGYAERAGFASDPVEDWLRAEREIDATLDQRLAS